MTARADLLTTVREYCDQLRDSTENTEVYALAGMINALAMILETDT